MYKINIIYITDKDIKHHNSIELIKQEGFVFKIFKPSVEQKDTDIDNFTSNLEEDVIKSLAVEKSTFFISSRERLLNVRVINFFYNFLIFY